MAELHAIPTHKRFQDLRGRRFGLLSVTAYAGNRSRHHLWKCLCDCGQSSIVQAGNLLTGHTTSCGCVHAAMVENGECRARHRKSHSAEWHAWQHMKRRCFNQRDKAFGDYGARGIRPCAGFCESFDTFYAVMGDKPSAELSIDRMDNTRGYDCGECEDCKSRNSTLNCRWATSVEQNNNRRNSHFITANGQTKSVAEWARELGVRTSTIHQRLRYGWSEERAVTTIVTPY